MHALLVTFRPNADPETIMHQVKQRVPDFAATPGLVMKTYLMQTPERWGGFYLFDSEQQAEAYAGGEFFSWFRQSGLIAEVELSRFAVEDAPSVAMGTPTTPLSQAHAR